MASAQSYLRDIHLFGSLAIIFGSLMMFASLGGAFLFLATNAYLEVSPLKVVLTVIVALIGGWTMVATGAEFARASEETIRHREGLRLDWTALLIVLSLATAVGSWTFQPLAFLCNLWILGLFWIRISILELLKKH